MPFRLPHLYWEPLQKAVLARFPKESELACWLEYNFTFRIAAFKNGDHYPTVARQFLEHVEKSNAWEELVVAGARETHLDIRCREIARLMLLAEPKQPTNAATAPNTLDLNRDEYHFLWDGHPFVDRQSFWFDIEELAKSQRQRVLTIRGPDDSGKTYCAEVLQYLLDPSRSNARLGRIGLGEDGDLPYDVELDEVCDVLQDKLQIPWHLPRPMFVPGEKPDRWARELGRWFGRHISAIGDPAWVIIDGLDHADVRVEVRLFYSTLAKSTCDPSCECLRVVFIDGTDALGKIPTLVTRDRPLEYLMAQEIHEYFARLDTLHDVSRQHVSLWDAAQEFIDAYKDHASGSLTQVESLSQVLVPLVKSLYRAIRQR